MVDKKKKRKQVSVDIGLHDWLFNYCRETGRSMKFVVDSLVEKYKKEREEKTKEVISYAKK